MSSIGEAYAMRRREGIFLQVKRRILMSAPSFPYFS
jgi:hypothetical protein